MNKLLNFIKHNKYLVLAGLMASLIIILFIVSLYQQPQSSGGSGVIDQPQIIIKGWDQKNQFDVAIGKAITLDQTNYIKQVILKDLGQSNQAYQAQIINLKGQFDRAKKIDNNQFDLKINDQLYHIEIDYQLDLVEVSKNQILLKL